MAEEVSPTVVPVYAFRAGQEVELIGLVFDSLPPADVLTVSRVKAGILFKAQAIY